MKKVLRKDKKGSVLMIWSRGNEGPETGGLCRDKL